MRPHGVGALTEPKTKAVKTVTWPSWAIACHLTSSLLRCSWWKALAMSIATKNDEEQEVVEEEELGDSSVTLRTMNLAKSRHRTSFRTDAVLPVPLMPSPDDTGGAMSAAAPRVEELDAALVSPGEVVDIEGA